MSEENNEGTNPEQDQQNQTQNQSQNDDQGLDLESLLSEYDEDTGDNSGPSQQDQSNQDSNQADTGGSQVDPNQISEVLDYVRSKRQEEQAQAAKESVEQAVSTIKEESEALKNVPDWVVEGALHAKANKDPRVIKAYENRNSNPDGWKKVLKGVANELSSDMKQQPDSKLTEDRDAARQAVSGQQSQNASDDNKPDPAELNKMSDEEFEAAKEAGQFG